MNETEVRQLIEKLDNRYITKEEFQSEVLQFVETKFATRSELLEALGRIDAIKAEGARSIELLQDLHAITIKTMEQTAKQTVAIEHLNKELLELRRHATIRLWDNIPYPIRSVISFVVLWILLIISTTIIGEQADTLMQENGLYVFFGNAIISLISSRDWRDKKELKK